MHGYRFTAHRQMAQEMPGVKLFFMQSSGGLTDAALARKPQGRRCISRTMAENCSAVSCRTSDGPITGGNQKPGSTSAW